MDTSEENGALAALHREIDRRVQTIVDGSDDWPCRKGCDRCCRRLAAVPQLTSAEWRLLKAGLALLPPETMDSIRQKIHALTGNPTGLIVCPLLEESSGACPVYAQRPVACRTYGFYVQRTLGLYCNEIEQRVAQGALADVVWGNHDAIDRQLAALGPQRALTDWFAASEFAEQGI